MQGLIGGGPRVVGSGEDAPSGVAREFNSLVQQITDLTELVRNLDERLTAVCLPATPKNKTGGPADAQRSPLGAGIASMRGTLSEVADQVRDILARLEI